VPVETIGQIGATLAPLRSDIVSSDTMSTTTEELAR
jgi:hypothetical protein